MLPKFLRYGTVASPRQGQIIQSLGLSGSPPTGQAAAVAQAVIQTTRGAGLRRPHGGPIQMQVSRLSQGPKHATSARA